MSEALPERAPEDTVAVHVQKEGGGEEVITVPHSPSSVVAPRELPPLPPAPAVIILRGISGSGKSSLAKHFSSLALAAHPAPSTLPRSPYDLAPPPPPHSIVCSADAFFIHRGVYRFDTKRLSQAHAHCQSHFLSLLSAATPHIIVDNTNIERWQYATYARMAQLLGYSVVIVEVRVSGEQQLSICAERNQHGVAFQAVQSQMDKWEEEPAAIVVHAVWTAEEKVRMKRREEQRLQRAAEWAQREAAWAASRVQPTVGGVDPSTAAVQAVEGGQERGPEVQPRRGWSGQPQPQPSFVAPPSRGFRGGLRGREVGGHRGGGREQRERGVGYQGGRGGYGAAPQHHHQAYPPYPPYQRSQFPRPLPSRGSSPHSWVPVQHRQLPDASVEGDNGAVNNNGEPPPPVT